MMSVKSFQVDHTKLTTGIYYSQYLPHSIVIDLRLCYPRGFCEVHKFKFMPMSQTLIHYLEHVMATKLRELSPNTFAYVGPMGCATGFYLLVNLHLSNKQEEIEAKVLEALNKTFDWLYNEAYDGDELIIPANNPKQCGNPIYDTEALKDELATFLAFHYIDKANFTSIRKYPE